MSYGTEEDFNNNANNNNTYGWNEPVVDANDQRNLATLTISRHGFTCWGDASINRDATAVAFDGVIIDDRLPGAIGHPFIRGRYVPANSSPQGVYEGYLIAIASGAVGDKRTITVVFVGSKTAVFEVNVLWLLAASVHTYFTNPDQLSWNAAIWSVLAAVKFMDKQPEGIGAFAPYYGRPIVKADIKTTIDGGHTLTVHYKRFMFASLNVNEAVTNNVDRFSGQDPVVNLWGLDFATQMQSPQFRSANVFKQFVTDLVAIAVAKFSTPNHRENVADIIAAMNANFDQAYINYPTALWLGLVFESIVASYEIPKTLIELVYSPTQTLLKYVE
jgi:hypothetical protein